MAEPALSPETTPRRSGRWHAMLVAVLLASTGWLVADRVLATATGREDEPSASLWPASMTATSPPWETTAATLSHTSSEERVLRTAIYDSTGRIASTIRRDEGSVHYEILGVAGFIDASSGGEWKPVDREDLDKERRLVSIIAEPPHVRELIPALAEAFVTIEEGDRHGDTTRFVVTFDRRAFSETHPIAAKNWHPSYFVVSWEDDYTWTLDVRDDGYITRWQDPTPGMLLRWEPSAPIDFASPLG